MISWISEVARQPVEPKVNTLVEPLQKLTLSTNPSVAEFRRKIKRPIKSQTAAACPIIAAGEMAPTDDKDTLSAAV